MISTRTFSRYASLWGALTPTLEHVVRWFNQNVEHVTRPVKATGGEPANNSLIAESAFAIVAKGCPRDGVVGNRDIEAVRAHLQRFGLNPPSDTLLDADELQEVSALADALRTMTSDLEAPEYWPPVPGCGVVDSAYADIRVAQTLYEVKTVSRPFRGPDVRQLLTYSAMLEASGQTIEYVGLLNPRLGRAVTASLEFVCQGSSGLTRAELMREIARRMADMQVSG